MNILVIGDIMLDINYMTTINRKAPEANIPIHDIQQINYILGGSSNVAHNLKCLNTNVELISVIGNDETGEKIQNLLKEKEIRYNLFIDKNRKTTQKNRIFYNEELVLRYDNEERNDVPNEIQEQILDYICLKAIKKIDAIVISDYDKGVITENLCKKIIDFANEYSIYTFVDPKIKNVNKYKNCFCFKPNLNEIEIMTNENDNDINKMFNKIKETICPTNIVLTCGEKGIYVNNCENHIAHDTLIQPIDVTGAGDVVLCILVYIFLLKKDLLLASKIANYIAGKSVQTIGNYNISLRNIDEYFIKERKQEQFRKLKQNKIIYDYETDKIQEIKNILTDNNNEKSKIVFTNGCFDIIHSAHIKNLQFAKKQGDILVVGINSDESVKRLKGESRPINNIRERCELLSLFDFINYIIVFNDDTPLNIIKHLTPHTIVKGSDYKKEQIVGAEYADNIVLFDYIEGKSSSLVIKKILEPEH